MAEWLIMLTDYSQMSDKWWYAKFGRSDGPMSLSELKDKLRDVDTRKVFIWGNGFENWKRVEDVPELMPQQPLRFRTNIIADTFPIPWLCIIGSLSAIATAILFMPAPIIRWLAKLI